MRVKLIVCAALRMPAWAGRIRRRAIRGLRSGWGGDGADDCDDDPESTSSSSVVATNAITCVVPNAVTQEAKKTAEPAESE